MRLLSLFSPLMRSVRRFRRSLAALCAGLAVLAGLSALSQPTGDLSWIVVTSRALPAGEVLQADDLTRVRWPSWACPQQRLDDPAPLLGRALVIALPANAAVVEGAVVGPTAAVGVGLMVVPVQLISAADGLIRPGDRIDLIGMTGDGEAATVLAAKARVVALPRRADEGGLIATTGTANGVLALVEVKPAEAAKLAESSPGRPVSFAFR